MGCLCGLDFFCAVYFIKRRSLIFEVVFSKIPPHFEAGRF
jgi:hypothetical protein